MTDPAPIVRIVDDDRSFLRALSRLLRAEGFKVLTFPSAAELIADLHPEVPGCVVADLRMPGVDGLQLQGVLSRISDTLPMLFLSGHSDVPHAVRAMRQGAIDFLTKGAPKEELLQAVQRALERDRHDRASRLRQKELHTRLATLTAREREVLMQVVTGKPNKQIADHLGIRERTVKLHRTAITTKLQVHSVAELTRFAQAAGLPMDGDSPPPP